MKIDFKVLNNMSRYTANNLSRNSQVFASKNASAPSFTGIGLSAGKAARNLLSKGRKFVQGSEIKYSDFDKLKNTLNSAYGSKFQDLIETGKKAGLVWEASDSVSQLVLKNEGVIKRIAKAISYPLTGLPLDLLDTVSGKLSKIKTFSKLNSSQILENHRAKNLLQTQMGSLKGILKQTNKLVQNGTDNSKAIAGLDKTLAKVFSEGTGKYSTPKERSVARFVSSIIPAFYIANDAYNSARRNGATDEEAKKAADERKDQLVRETVLETYEQYATLGAMSEFVNTKTWGAPLVNTIVALTSQIFSRASKGKSLTPVKIQSPQLQNGLYEMNTFLSASKDGVQSVEQAFKGDKTFADSTAEKKKKPLLTVKNVLLFCAASVAAGFALRYGRIKFADYLNKNTNKDNRIVSFFNSIKNKYNAFTKETVKVKPEQLQDYFKQVEKTGNTELAQRWSGELKQHSAKLVEDGFITLTTEADKKLKLPFIKQELPVKYLLKAVTFPVTIVKEFISYPYKAVQKILGALGSSKIFKSEKFEKIGKKLVNWSGSGSKVSLGQEKLFTNKMSEIYGDYMRQLKKHNVSKSGNFDDFYKKHFNEKLLSAFDIENRSMIDNSKLAKMTQLMTMATSTYFVTVDDYNQTALQTNDKEKASKSARERFVQKIMRVMTQIGLMEVFNNLFKSQYTGSLAGVAAVTALNTLATDTVSRTISGQPLGRYSKEEQEALEQKRLNGPLGWWHKLMKKLSS